MLQAQPLPASTFVPPALPSAAAASIPVETFPLATEERGAIHQLRFQEQLEEDRKREEQARNYVAQPIMPVEEKPELPHHPAIQPEPFALQSEVLHQEAMARMQQSLVEQKLKEEEQRKYHAQPIAPCVSSRLLFSFSHLLFVSLISISLLCLLFFCVYSGVASPWIPQPANRPPIQQEPFNLVADERVAARNQFDEKVEQKRQEAAAMRRQEEEEKKKAEEERDRAARQANAFKAKPFVKPPPFQVSMLSACVSVSRCGHYSVLLLAIRLIPFLFFLFVLL